ncbi:MAG: hypothetical protein EOO14_06265 [Chitinophagaceae bacterium]|nr:MAG: hypothetical protein EOO14_06265 [Chitinophagaceae bacterium]
MQPSLFTPKQLRQVTKPKEWTATDVFPFGKWKGKTLSTIAAIEPTYLEWWQRTKNAQLSNDLLKAISLAKFLNQ